ncbi:MAG: hypothetical protein ACKV22_01165 [Bryobacteraceae bacterium]
MSESKSKAATMDKDSQQGTGKPEKPPVESQAPKGEEAISPQPAPSAEEPAPAAVQAEIVVEEAAHDETSEYVLTVSTNTGDILRVEKLDRAGGRTELTEDEYSAVFCAAGYEEEYPEESADESAYPQDPYEAGYTQGIADYQAALEGGTAQLTPEEIAYYQGVADYQEALESAVAQSGATGYTSEEIAYYQGMADCEKALSGSNS